MKKNILSRTRDPTENPVTPKPSVIKWNVDCGKCSGVDTREVDSNGNTSQKLPSEREKMGAVNMDTSHFQPVEKTPAPPVPEISNNGDIYSLKKLVAQGYEDFQREKNIKMLTPPPESSFSYDDTAPIWACEAISSPSSSSSCSLPVPVSSIATLTESNTQKVSSSLSGKTFRTRREGKDEKIGREKGITVFISVYDIINMPMDEFNDKIERFKQTGMTDEQVTISRDIRRRGKNKNAAQNCRKRSNDKLDQYKIDRDEENAKKARLEREETRIMDVFRTEKRFAGELEGHILRQENVDRHSFTLQDDYLENEVRFKKVVKHVPPLEIIPQDRTPEPPPPTFLPLPGSNMRTAFQLPSSCTSSAFQPKPHITLQRVDPTHQPYTLPTTNFPPRASLFPSPLRPQSVSLFPLKHGMSFYPGNTGIYLTREPMGTPSHLTRDPLGTPSHPIHPPASFGRLQGTEDPSSSLMITGDRSGDNRRCVITGPHVDHHHRDNLIKEGQRDHQEYLSRGVRFRDVTFQPVTETEIMHPKSPLIKEEKPEDLSIVSEDDVKCMDQYRHQRQPS